LHQSRSVNSVRNYFSAAAKEVRAAAAYTEERCVCFPGYAVLRHRDDESIIEVEASGFVFRTRPLAQANRTQRLFVTMAKQLAGLRSLPASISTDSLALEDPPLLAGSSADFDPKATTFARLLALGHLPATASDAEIDEAIKGLQLVEEPEEMAFEASASEQEESPERGQNPPPMLRKRSNTFDSTMKRSAIPALTTSAGDLLSRRSTTSTLPDEGSARSQGSTGSATANLVADPDLAHLHQNLTERVGCLLRPGHFKADLFSAPRLLLSKAGRQTDTSDGVFGGRSRRRLGQFPSARPHDGHFDVRWRLQVPFSILGDARQERATSARRPVASRQRVASSGRRCDRRGSTRSN
jgi:hypothetical protein